jgi:hypothetical protein
VRDSVCSPQMQHVMVTSSVLVVFRTAQFAGASAKSAITLSLTTNEQTTSRSSLVDFHDDGSAGHDPLGSRHLGAQLRREYIVLAALLRCVHRAAVDATLLHLQTKHQA